MAFPTQPFNGQIFIDSYRMKWEYDGSANFWKKIGLVSTLPVSTEIQSGLLSSQFKQLLDGIPKNGGHFGIIAKPLLSLSSRNAKTLYKGLVKLSNKTNSGTTIKLLDDRPISIGQFAGKILIFKTGLLQNKVFLILDNIIDELYLEGSAEAAYPNDEFIIVDKSEFNPSGAIYGNLMLVSDSLDIKCIDGNGKELSSTCNNLDIIQCGPPGSKPPGFDFTINQDFINNLCVTVPGCKGPKGKTGEAGLPGIDGTGDGPIGEVGDDGVDATEALNFAGVEIIDVDDIYDSAIVSMELDAENGKLNIIRAKIRTPDDETPANQVISTPIDRSVRFLEEDSFKYEILMPTVGDPINEVDIDLLKYPRLYTPEQAGDETNLEKVKLSSFINKIIEDYQNRLSQINDEYNLVLKQYIEDKDSKAREILANLAQQLSECEWELPLDFCLGLSPNDCHPNSGGNVSAGFGDTFTYPYASIIFGNTGTGTNIGLASDLGSYLVKPKTEDVVTDNKVLILYPNQSSPLAISNLPPGGYIIQYVGGVVRSSGTDWIVGSATSGIGLIATVKTGGETFSLQMPVPSIEFNPKEKSSVELAYAEAELFDKIIVVEISHPDGGSITLSSPLPGLRAQGTIAVRVIRVELNG